MKPRRKRNKTANQWLVLSARLRRWEVRQFDAKAERADATRAGYLAGLVRAHLGIQEKP